MADWQTYIYVNILYQYSKFEVIVGLGRGVQST